MAGSSNSSSNTQTNDEIIFKTTPSIQTYKKTHELDEDDVPTTQNVLELIYAYGSDKLKILIFIILIFGFAVMCIIFIVKLSANYGMQNRPPGPNPYYDEVKISNNQFMK